MEPAVQFYTDTEVFYTDVESFLAADEVTNSLILGVVSNLRRQMIPRRRHPSLMVSVSDGKKPLLVAVKAANQKLLLAGETDRELIGYLARRIAQRRTTIPALLGQSLLAFEFAQQWATLTDSEITPGLRQRLYKATQVTFPADFPNGKLITAPLEYRELLSQWVLDFQTEALPNEAGDLDSARIIIDRVMANNDLYTWQIVENGTDVVVSMAAKARPTKHGIAINLVYTPPEYRRLGFASACVARLTELLLSSGWEFCTLFTDRSNKTSNHIYMRIGYVPVTDFDEYRIAPRRKLISETPSDTV